MKKIPFQKSEFEVLDVIPNPFGDAGKDDVMVHHASISHRENYRSTIQNRESMWVPSFYDMFMFPRAACRITLPEL